MARIAPRRPLVLQPTRLPVKVGAPACTPECFLARGRGLLSLESAFPF